MFVLCLTCEFVCQDVMVLNDIIDQVSERPQSKATHFSSAYQVRNGGHNITCNTSNVSPSG